MFIIIIIYYLGFKLTLDFLIYLDQTLLADVIANVTNNVFVQRKVIVESFSHYNEKQSNISVQESIEQIRDLKSVTGKNIQSFSTYKAMKFSLKEFF